MEPGPLPEDDPRPPARTPGTIVPALLCGAIVALGVLSWWGKRPEAPDRGPQWVPSLSRPAAPPAPVGLLLFDSPPARQLTRLLDAAWSVPGIEGLVPNLAPVRLPPDMDELDLESKKEVFFRSVLPHILAANRRIRAERARLMALAERLGSGDAAAWEDSAFVRDLAERYRINPPQTEPPPAIEALIEELLHRVDVVPPSLALAQAALESAWGGSRFAKLGNSLFGQWVFSSDKGITPLLRDEGANYSVARFVDLSEAVDAYVRNLNSFWAYQEFRTLRRGMRLAGEALDPHALADGLLLYSIRREEYVDEVRKVVRDNRLHRFEGKRLAPLPEAVWSELLAVHGEVASFRWVNLDDGQAAQESSRAGQSAGPVGADDQKVAGQYGAHKPWERRREMGLTLTSTAFVHQGEIPVRYTCEGEDVSVPLAWSGVPEGTRSLALIVDDPDAPDPRAPRMTWVHWVLYNLPASAGELPEGVKVLPPGTRQGRNDWNRTGYGGPCPPVGRHRYFHKLYALSEVLPDLGMPTKARLEQAMEGKVLARAELVGTYQKKK